MTRDSSTPRRKPWNKWAVYGVVVGAVALIGGITGVVNSLMSGDGDPTPAPTSASPAPIVSEAPEPSVSATP